MAQTTHTHGPPEGAQGSSPAAHTDGGADRDLWHMVERAAEEVDPRKAELVCEALLAHLTEQPDAVRELRALIVLGLAHPKALSSREGFLVKEGRRLATLLEHHGEAGQAQQLLELLSRHHPEDKKLDHELASLMQRSGNADRLVERHMRRAEEALREGRRDDAIQWLREVLSVDRSRRDAARMIRDLQYETSAKRRAWRRRLRSFAALMVLACVVSASIWREVWLSDQYAAIPPAVEGDRLSLEERLQSIDTIVARNPLWLGAFRASKERAGLRASITRLETAEMQASIAAVAEAARRLDEAESLHVRYRMALDQRDYAGAIEHLQNALEVAPQDWPPRARAQADVQALTELMQTQGQGGPPGR